MIIKLISIEVIKRKSGEDDLIPVVLSNDMHSKVWDEIINPFPNFNGASDFTPHFAMDVTTYPRWDYR